MKSQNIRYKEIYKLLGLLAAADIPFDFRTSFVCKDGAQIIIWNNSGEQLCDAVEHDWSNGADNDRIEILGGLTEEEEKIDSVKGNLTAQEVFERFKYCYENNTSRYVAK